MPYGDYGQATVLRGRRHVMIDYVVFFKFHGSIFGFHIPTRDYWLGNKRFLMEP